MAGNDLGGNHRPLGDESLATPEFEDEDKCVDNDDENRDYGDAGWPPRCTEIGIRPPMPSSYPLGKFTVTEIEAQLRARPLSLGAERRSAREHEAIRKSGHSVSPFPHCRFGGTVESVLRAKTPQEHSWGRKTP